MDPVFCIPLSLLSSLQLTIEEVIHPQLSQKHPMFLQVLSLLTFIAFIDVKSLSGTFCLCNAYLIVPRILPNVFSLFTNTWCSLLFFTSHFSCICLVMKIVLIVDFSSHEAKSAAINSSDFLEPLTQCLLPNLYPPFPHILKASPTKQQCISSAFTQWYSKLFFHSLFFSGYNL